MSRVWVFLSFIVFCRTDETLAQKDSRIIDSATAFVSFIVEPTGDIQIAKVIRVDCAGCSKKAIEYYKTEALHLIHQVQDLEIADGKRVKFIQPVKFYITDSL